MSEFTTLDELEDNTSAKKVKEVAREFYLDKTRNFGQRAQAFMKYGEHKVFLLHSKHPELESIYENAYASGCYNRHETLNCYWLIEDHPERERLAELMFEEGVAKFDIDW